MDDNLCKLCRVNPPIENSHVLPKSAYKRYVSNLDRGGQFVDLGRMARDSRQLKRPWFCLDCEKLFGESYAGKILTELDRSRTGCKYTGELLRYATGLSLRTCLLDLHEGETSINNAAILRRVRGVWREYLLGKTQTVGPYTQHVCIVADLDSLWSQRIGGQVAYVHNLVITQIGPLIVFGRLKGQSRLTRDERNALNRTELTNNGGMLQTISQTEKNLALTDDMADLLNHADQWCIDRASEFDLNTNGRS